MGAGPLTRKWGLAQSWRAACEVVAATYGVDEALIAAESRGRGPRPPEAVWEAKKVAIHLAVVLSDCNYAALGRLIGLTRDTVASHCADVRKLADADSDEVSLHTLEMIARGRLGQFDRQRIDALRASLAVLESQVGDLPSKPFIRHSSDVHPTTHPTKIGDHGNVKPPFEPGEAP